MVDIVIPPGLWDTGKTPEGIVANWFYRSGSAVEEGDTVAELMVEKTSYDIVAPASGTLTVTVPKDGVVTPGSVIGTVG
ncbi:biotin/lipoyl-containing protein [Polymorphum gilvum]|uniref:Dihydrolipoyllysine-residue succinyltransferase component of 2-oxoglutarate dehydrogenase complex (E2) n=1 Tax=Polymorphum gilvum (strain LMG 25793 / CGMCC 1.9160 / SL003B-26A1) TaxID=991905 RepID=F2J2H3_POLGS|nr:biotin/lipoyl-containing protein [Polymorphum gilvum]ADZ70888.1 Dihydrolipoyllysine-residue succinyltransferase component of 2-oxoglutarate dehydrogenase complex (E2) [Polymorphum gilvum SL003B-26A1]